MTGETQTRIGQLEEAFPYGVEGVHICDNGEDFLVIEVNQEWMFRFPRNASARRALHCERRFLPRFEKLSPVPVPQIRYSGEDFIGYRKIEGVLLTPRLFNTLRCEARKRIAGQLGDFLSTLHTFPLDQALEMGLTEGWNGWREKAYQSFRENAAPLLSATARNEAIAFLERFFALEWKRVVIHGDFYPSDHVFVDEGRQEVSGVIDFGDLTIEDAATDFQSILEDYGEDFLRDVTACYTIEVDASFLDRIRTRIKARPLFDVAYALEYGFAERFRRRLSEIEAVFGGENCA